MYINRQPRHWRLHVMRYRSRHTILVNSGWTVVIQRVNVHLSAGVRPSDVSTPAGRMWVLTRGPDAVTLSKSVETTAIGFAYWLSPFVTRNECQSSQTVNPSQWPRGQKAGDNPVNFNLSDNFLPTTQTSGWKSPILGDLKAFFEHR